MKKLHVCPHCENEHSGIVSRWDYDGGELFDDLIRIFDCPECGHWFTGDEGFLGWQGQPDDNPSNDIPLPDVVENDEREC